MDAWTQVVRAEMNNVPEGHPRRTRYLAHAALALESAGDCDDCEQLYRDAFESLQTADPLDESGELLYRVVPDYHRRNGQDQAAQAWEQRLAEYAPGGESG